MSCVYCFDKWIYSVQCCICLSTICCKCIPNKFKGVWETEADYTLLQYYEKNGIGYITTGNWVSWCCSKQCMAEYISYIDYANNYKKFCIEASNKLKNEQIDIINELNKDIKQKVYESKLMINDLANIICDYLKISI